MPWRPIQTGTAGLLSLMAMKNVGKNPDSLLETVTPTLDMVEWWMRSEARPESVDGVMAATSESFTPVGTIAHEREWVYVHYGFFVISSAVSTITVSANIQKPAPGPQTIWGSDFSDSKANAGVFFSVLGVRDLWIPPGFRLTFNAFGVIGDSIGYGALTTRVAT